MEGIEDPSFRPEADSQMVAEAAGGGQPARRPDHVIARGLVGVFRVLALIAGIWGFVNIVYAVEASRAARKVVQESRGFPGDRERVAQAAQSAAAFALFAAAITAAAAVAFPLGMAEVIRLCLLVEANTRVASQTPACEKDRRGRK